MRPPVPKVCPGKTLPLDLWRIYGTWLESNFARERLGARRLSPRDLPAGHLPSAGRPDEPLPVAKAWQRQLRSGGVAGKEARTPHAKPKLSESIKTPVNALVAA